MHDGRSVPSTFASMNASGNDNPPAIQRLRPVMHQAAAVRGLRPEVSIRRRSLPAPGSVIENDAHTSPVAIAGSQRARWSSVP